MLDNPPLGSNIPIMDRIFRDQIKERELAMQLNVTFKNISSSPGLKDYAQEKLDRLDKLLDSPGKADVVFSVEHQQSIVEVSLSSNRITAQASEEHPEMRAAIDLVVDKLKKQITKTKEKQQQHRDRQRSAADIPTPTA